jgi:hypothetical protein
MRSIDNDFIELKQSSINKNIFFLNPKSNLGELRLPIESGIEKFEEDLKVGDCVIIKGIYYIVTHLNNHNWPYYSPI